VHCEIRRKHAEVILAERAQRTRKIAPKNLAGNLFLLNTARGFWSEKNWHPVFVNTTEKNIAIKLHFFAGVREQ
jgi:hypothetical protein